MPLRLWRLLPYVCLACAGLLPGSAPAAPVPGEVLTVGIHARLPGEYHPLLARNIFWRYLSGFVQRSLGFYDSDWQPVCFQCVIMPSLENGGVRRLDLPGGKQGMAVTYTLRPDLAWGDGIPVTTEDAVLTLTIARKLGTRAVGYDYFAHMLRVEPLDAHRFTLVFDTVNFGYVDGGQFYLLPAHLEAPILAASATAAAYIAESRYTRDPTLPGLWTGPFRIAESQASFLAVARLAPADPSQHGFREIRFRPVEDEGRLAQALLDGEVDYVPGEFGLSPSRQFALAQAAPGRFAFLAVPSNTLRQLALNLDNPLLADRNCRAALLLALDRSALLAQGDAAGIARTQLAFHEIADSFAASRDPGYDREVPTYRYDPDRAKALFEAAGFHPGADGILVSRDGRRFSLSSKYSGESAAPIESWLQRSWLKVGVELVLEELPSARLFEETLPNRDYETALFNIVRGPEDAPDDWLSSAAIPSPGNGRAGFNVSGFRNAAMDTALSALAGELDPVKRRPIWHRIHMIYTSELPSLPLFTADQTYLVPRWLKGFVTAGQAPVTSYWSEQWRADPQ